MNYKEQVEAAKKAVVASESVQGGKSPGLIVKIILAVFIGVVLHDAVKTFVMINTDTPGASKDFAESSKKGLADYERLKKETESYLSKDCQKVRTEQGDSAINDRPECF